jgi:ribonuclease-3
MSDVRSDISPELAVQLQECQQRLAYQFQSPGLLISALTHSSGASHKLASNERLEFLGDAILGAIVCDLLFRRFPHLLEGDLTKIKSEVVSRRSCAAFTRQLALQEFLIVGKGMGSPEKVPRSLLADLFESLVAAIYLDGGMEAAREFVERAIEPMLDQAAEEGSPDNYKSILQQRTQRDRGTTPVYELLGERGPDHAKSFQICAVIGMEAFSPAWGRNKKEAEQRAACNALAELHGQPAPFQGE